MSDDVSLVPIIKKSFKWLVKDPTFILLYLIPATIIVIQTIHMVIFLGGTSFEQFSYSQGPQFFNLFFPWTAWITFYTIISFLVGLIVFAVIIQKVQVRINGREIKLKKAFSRGLSRAPSLLGAYLLLLLLLIGPFAGFIGLMFYGFLNSGLIIWMIIGVLGMLVWFFLMIYYGVRLSLFGPACIIEELGPIDTLKKSWSVTENNFWMTFALYVLYAVLSWIIVLPTNFLQMSGMWIGSLIAPVATSIIIGPAFSIAVTLYYINLSEDRNFF